MTTPSIRTKEQIVGDYRDLIAARGALTDETALQQSLTREITLASEAMVNYGQPIAYLLHEIQPG